MEFVIFAVTSVIALIGASMMVLSRNAVHSALYLLLNFGAIAILYLLLLSPFLFAVQLAVYAGAIVVLFLFVVMLLGAERAEDEHDSIAWQKPLAMVLGLVLLGQALVVAFRQTRVGAPQPAEASFGSPTELATLLFTDYLLPVEVTSIILLIAMVGVVTLNKARKERSA
jgi:NADH-quinone oxidoreductase subunit J